MWAVGRTGLSLPDGSRPSPSGRLSSRGGDRCRAEARSSDWRSTSLAGFDLPAPASRRWHLAIGRADPRASLLGGRAARRIAHGDAAGAVPDRRPRRLRTLPAVARPAHGGAGRGPDRSESAAVGAVRAVREHHPGRRRLPTLRERARRRAPHDPPPDTGAPRGWRRRAGGRRGARGHPGRWPPAGRGGPGAAEQPRGHRRTRRPRVGGAVADPYAGRHAARDRGPDTSSSPRPRKHPMPPAPLAPRRRRRQDQAPARPPSRPPPRRSPASTP